MEIRITECEATSGGRNFIEDLSNYDSFDKWLQDLISGGCQYNPLNSSIKFGGQWHTIWEAGQIAEDAEKTLKQVNLPAACLR